MAARDEAPLLQWDVGSRVNSVAVSHDSTRVASGSYDNQIRIWDLYTGTLVLWPLEGHTNLVRSVAWSHDDSRLVSGSNDHTIRIWDPFTGVSVGEPLEGHTNWVWSVAFSPDSTRVVSGSQDNTIRVWDAITGAPIGEPLVGHTQLVSTVSISPNGARIVSGSHDNTIRMWNARTGAAMGKPLKGHAGPVLSVAFSHDSTRIVSGSADKTIHIWNALTGDLIGDPLRGHTGSVWSVTFTLDSARIGSGSVDETICVWDALTGTLIGNPLRGHAGSVWSVAFTPDSTRITSGSVDGTICVWEMPQRAPSFDMVTSSMSTEEMFDCLVQHGCRDLSSLLDSSQCALLPITNGGFGDVWRVIPGSGSMLAVKTLRFQDLLRGDSKGAKRAAREVHHWSKLQHPNVQELLGIAVFRGGLGMVSPWLEYGNLPNYIAQHPEVERHPLCIQLTSGVAYLHSVEMVHGDLKAARIFETTFVWNNVLVSDDGTLKINDFDYAVLSDSSLRFSTTTRAGGGTMRWMAPELYEAEDEEQEGEPKVTRNKETDIYALGMTMLEIFTGAVPFAEYRTDAGVCGAVLRKQIPRRPSQLLGPDKTTKQVWKLLVKCWSRDPGARPEAAALLRLLRSYGNGTPEAAGADSTIPDTVTPISATSSASTLTRLRTVYKNIVK